MMTTTTPHDDVRFKLLSANAVRARNMTHCLAHLKSSEQIAMDVTVASVSWDDAGRNLVQLEGGGTSLSCWGPSSTDVTAEAIVQGKWTEKEGPRPSQGHPPPLTESVQQLILRETKKAMDCCVGPTCVEFQYASADDTAALATAWAVRSEEDDDILLFWSNGSVQCAVLQRDTTTDRLAPTRPATLLLYPFGSTREAAVAATDVASLSCGDARASEWTAVRKAVSDAVQRASLLAASQAILVEEDGVPKAHVAHTERGGKVLNLHGTGRHGLVELVGGYTVPAFVLRASPNWDETLCTVPLNRIRAVVEEEGLSSLTPVTLHDLAKRAGTYGRVAGVAEGTDLTNGRADETCTVRIQAVILPKPADGSAADYTTYCHHYQTRHDASPGSMYVLATPLGSFYSTSRAGNAAVKPYQYDAASGVLSSFCLSVGSSGKAVDDAVYTKADRAAQAASNVGVAADFGPVGFPPSANMTMLFQLPILPKPPPAPPPAPWRGLGGEEEEYELGEGVKYRNLSAGDSLQEEGDVTVASLGFGAYDGDALKVADSTPVRASHIAPTVTICLFYSLDAPTGSSSLPGECAVSTSDLKTICKEMEKLYHIMGNGRSLSDVDSKLAHLVTKDMHAATLEDLKEAVAAKAATAKEAPPDPKRRRSAVVPPPVVAAHA